MLKIKTICHGSRKCVIVDENDMVMTNYIYANIAQAQSYMDNKLFEPAVRREKHTVSYSDLVAMYWK